MKLNESLMSLGEVVESWNSCLKVRNVVCGIYVDASTGEIWTWEGTSGSWPEYRDYNVVPLPMGAHQVSIGKLGMYAQDVLDRFAVAASCGKNAAEASELLLYVKYPTDAEYAAYCGETGGQ